MEQEFGLMATPVLSPFSINRYLYRQKRKISFTIESIGLPIVTSTTLLGELRLNISWCVTPE
tara:strand:+ start:193 stop:378 length:186 start_codon:yes stop_codon:yes gene_type:complete